MKTLGTLAFAALALVATTFAAAAPAKADSFGVYVGSNGFGLQFGNYGGYDDYYGGYYARNSCWDPYYGYVPCGHYSNYYPRHGGYYHKPRWHKKHWGHRGQWRDDGWRGGHRGGQRWHGGNRRDDGWRGGHRGGQRWHGGNWRDHAWRGGHRGGQRWHGGQRGGDHGWRGGHRGGQRWHGGQRGRRGGD
jgi:hypothetical protein